MLKIYQPRLIEFHSVTNVNTWNIKLYTITFQDRFTSEIVLENAINKLPEWLKKTKTLGLETYKAGFLIVHEGRDGFWILFNWWTGENMLQSVTFYTSFDDTNQFEETPKEGGMFCIWELEVVDFERKMWIEYILKKAENPDFEAYLNETLSGNF